MDYGKSGNPKSVRGAPRHSEHNAKGSRQNPFGGSDGKPGRGQDKAALLAQMKARAAARRSDDASDDSSDDSSQA